MKTLSIDIETYSDVLLSKTGVYRYCESPDFEILLFGYSVDSGPVQMVDLACGENIPAEIIVALKMNLSSNGPSMLPLNASVFPDFLVIRPVNTLIQKAGAAP